MQGARPPSGAAPGAGEYDSDAAPAGEREGPHGRRARIGLIVPSINIVAEPEYALLVPKEVAVYATRVPLRGRMTADSYRVMTEDVGRAAALLDDADVDVVSLACTAAAIAVHHDEIEKQVCAIRPVPAISSMAAILDALHVLGVRSVSLAAPYVEDVTAAEVAFLERAGFRVLAWQTLGLGKTDVERRTIGRVPLDTTARLARAVDRPEAEAVVLSCTNLATLPIIEALEREIGKPVVSSNQASVWRCLRVIGLDDRIPGYGRLFAEH